jgi:hypothetical protein
MAGVDRHLGIGFLGQTGRGRGHGQSTRMPHRGHAQRVAPNTTTSARTGHPPVFRLLALGLAHVILLPQVERLGRKWFWIRK